MNKELIRLNLLGAVQSEYGETQSLRKRYAIECSYAALDYLDKNESIIAVRVASFNQSRGSTRREQRQQYRQTLSEVKAYIWDNVDFNLSGITSFFFTFIAPLIVNWIAKKLMDLLYPAT